MGVGLPQLLLRLSVPLSPPALRALCLGTRCRLGWAGVSLTRPLPWQPVPAPRAKEAPDSAAWV